MRPVSASPSRTASPRSEASSARYYEKATAENVVRHVYGIRAVASDLTVNLEGAAPLSDSHLAEAMANALALDAVVPLNAVKATVTDGWVTLNGTVDWQYQRVAAQRAVEHLHGVRGVMNAIALKPHVSPADIKSKIEQAFKRSAEVDAARVKVEARDGEVILTGSVRALSERDEAERAAWSAPGVTRVEDRLTVSPF